MQRLVDGSVLLDARARAIDAACPRRRWRSGRVHGRYLRRVSDAAIAGARVVIRLLVRRFRCVNDGCAAVTFAEQVDGLTSPHARYTPLATRMHTLIALTLAGRPGARLAAVLGLQVAKDRLLRLLRGLTDASAAPVRVLGVDLSRLRDYPDGLLGGALGTVVAGGFRGVGGRGGRDNLLRLALANLSLSLSERGAPGRSRQDGYGLVGPG